MEKLEVDSKSGSEEEFFDCLGNYLKNFVIGVVWKYYLLMLCKIYGMHFYFRRQLNAKQKLVRVTTVFSKFRKTTKSGKFSPRENGICDALILQFVSRLFFYLYKIYRHLQR